MYTPILQGKRLVDVIMCIGMYWYVFVVSVVVVELKALYKKGGVKALWEGKALHNGKGNQRMYVRPAR